MEEPQEAAQTNIERLQQAYAAFGIADLPQLLGLMSPDLVWEFPPSTTIPWTGKLVGHQQTIHFFIALANMPKLNCLNRYVSLRRMTLRWQP